MLTSTGHASADAALRGLVDLFEAEFAGRVRGYYLEGSYADQTARRASDIDLIIRTK